MKISWLIRKTGWPLLGIVLLLAFGRPDQAGADTISWWRFEAGEDTDPDVAELSNPNEVAGQPAMISNNATLGTSAPDLFDTVVPGPNVPNTGSIRSYVNGATEDGIFGSAAYSDDLDVNSITVEFWVRTTENEAGFVARTTDATQSGENGDIDNGFRIVDPNNVRVDYWVSENNGNNPTMITIDSDIAINDGEWHYIAFTYNASTRVGSLIVDEDTTTIDSGFGQRRLWWGDNDDDPEPGVHIGYRLDGNPNNNTGTLDEIRFSDEALPPEDLLIGVVPEASTWWSMLALVLVLGGPAAMPYFRRAKT